MNGSGVYQTFDGISATHLHHANTVETSTTFLGQGGLLSRAYATVKRLPQTPQVSDKIDQQLGVWDDIFLDMVDIHDRGGRVRGYNVYGPVLFCFPLNILQHLPSNTDVCVTRLNPIKWKTVQADAERWFLTLPELLSGLRLGNFDQHIVLRGLSGKLPFLASPVEIILDDPKQNLSNGIDAYTHAFDRLTQAGNSAGVTINITKRNCKPDCKCLDKYKNQALVDHFFM
jgi:hypothetical protein